MELHQSQTSVGDSSCFKSSKWYGGSRAAATEDDEVVTSDEAGGMIFLGRRRRRGARVLVDRVMNILIRGRDLPSTPTCQQFLLILPVHIKCQIPLH